VISFCTTVKNRSRLQINGRELLLFPNCVRSLQRIGAGDLRCELVVTDWDSDDWPLHEWLEETAAPVPTTVITVRGGFSRGKGLNLAAQAAQGDILFFLDADALLCTRLIESSVKCASENSAYFPILYSFNDPDHQSGRWIDAGYGHCAVKKATFEQTQRWPEFNKWGGEDDQFYAELAAMVPIVRERVPGFFHQWHPDDLAWKNRYSEAYPFLVDHLQKAEAVRCLLEQCIPEGSTFILVDETRFGDDFLEGRRARPFLEENGEYAGPPPDDATAIRELEQMRADGATFVAFPWLAFWWLQHYTEFHEHILRHYRPALINENLTLFDLRTFAL
jgi:hypothetical protein